MQPWVSWREAGRGRSLRGKKIRGDSGTRRRTEKSHLCVPTFFLLFSIQGETIRKEDRLWLSINQLFDRDRNADNEWVVSVVLGCSHQQRMKENRDACYVCLKRQWCDHGQQGFSWSSGQMLPGVDAAGKWNCFRIHLPLPASDPGPSGRSSAVAQGNDVCGEAGFEQNAPLPVTVQLLDESVPIDDQAWPKSAQTWENNTHA